MSRRLNGELIGYVGLHRLSSGVRRPHVLNIFFSETTGQIKVKFHMEPPRDVEKYICSNGSGHMTKMPAMPIYDINFKKSTSPEPKCR